ncbi:MAG TPA: DUF2946 family protein [Burkholderiaceae bacterium]|nr:DUF2946 family protein [Burkholderiaceae bacterium]
MRTVRVLLLVLLASLLPARGVVAAATLCPPAAGTTSDAHAMHSPDGVMHDHSGAGLHQQADADTGATGHPHGGVSGHAKCNHCFACCSVPPLASAVPDVPVPRDLAAAAFPAPCVPAPSFLSDGQERPPRSI